MSRLRSIGFIIAASLVLLVAGMSSVAAKEFYSGKTITLLVGFGAGSGNTTQAHLFSRHLGKYIPGNPKIIVKNMPGAGSMKAMNFIKDKARPDGLTVSFGPIFAMNQVIEAKGVRFKYQDFTFVGGAYTAPRVMFMRKDIVPGGASQASDIMKAPELRYAAVNPTVILSLYGRPMLDMLGLKYRYIPGHKGGGKVRKAVQSGEANIAMHGLSGYRSSVEGTQIKSGVSMPLWYFPQKDAAGNFVSSPLVADFANYLDVYKAIKGGRPSGDLWNFVNLVADLDQFHNALLGPPNMNAAGAAALSKAYYALLKDETFRAEAQKLFGYMYEARDPAFAKKYFAALGNIDPQLVKFAKEYLAVSGK